LNFLPEQETDFIFAAIAEELGFFGSLLLLAFYVLLLVRCLRIARGTRDAFSFILVVGITIAFSIQIAVNVGMNIGLLPITGVPLPLVSAGGSSLIANLLAIGILQSVARRQRSAFYRQEA
jgi:rod shape determining protein RodA